MTIVRELMQDATIGVGISETPEGLSAIHRAGCAAAIWRRQPLPGFQSWINALHPDLLPAARVILRPDAVHVAAKQICAAYDMPECTERDRLIGDVAALATIFAEIIQARYLRLRFDVVTTNACSKFHVDAVNARLVCTYRGTGTQYCIGADPHSIFTVPTGAPIILRGTHWPETPHAGLLHRSPPIDGTGETRLLLVLDPADTPEEK